jgi:bacillithiol biosynthesis deacetylase BshB1
VSVDLLAIGAHPDDVDLGIGGILLKAVAQGRQVAILDLTRGELGTRGTPELRLAEATAAAAILGVHHRHNAGLPDGALANVPAQQQAVAAFIRALQPRVLLAPMAPDRHPDHIAAHALVRDANFLAGLSNWPGPGPPHRAAHVYFYHSYHEIQVAPAFTVDISAHWEEKLKALRAYASQFHNPSFEGKETLVSSPEFWEGIHLRAAYWGQRSGVRYAEPLYTDATLALPLPPGL